MIYIYETKSILRRDPCTPLASGYEAIDDSPAINDALKACGSGGTIVLPADQTYSIYTPIDFTPCKSCDFQIEGQLIIAGNRWEYWAGMDSVFTLSGVHDVRVRSLSGKGLIDGNAIGYYTTRFDSGVNAEVPFARITNGSSGISIENLTMKNVMHRFFRVERSSTNISLSNLKLSMEQQWGLNPRSQHDAVGIELVDTTNVAISNVDMNVKVRQAHAPGTAGICVAIDVLTHNVTVRNMTCTGAFGGALITLGIAGNTRLTPEQEANTVSNIYVSDLTFDGQVATGFLSLGVNSAMTNITWDGVTVLKGTPAEGFLCYLKCRCFTSYVPNCDRQLSSTVTGIWFKRFRGRLPAMPTDLGAEGSTPHTVREYHFEDWQNSTVV
ncbi:pectin lyase fold/virulence factor [Massariosphaeria phaeospora]|uniref:Pectin lyase fold/virulence factor n=1 Tax=Massariosphaeria phaeospora TaxID=100035 RepID=A0A7C8MJS6_9PLEO|nr:pectin lyase fold/virulence factor [Massariosphaeria phaeospora]